ncbi:hypothetical protein LTR70_007800 [Exophiala xenobiotica]|uniref:Uncharacterized protein n=1 Tax=Lithohypha guttulata TaxID=1690604 RepID=A0ABR0JZM0_9EURO|nr:hypothetical protein LTR24_008622 [Lithohypha guttulata]KAK5313108.1 hypothetical protein LTR70_007800 [Exophiala xenobiotica]
MSPVRLLGTQSTYRDRSPTTTSRLTLSKEASSPLTLRGPISAPRRIPAPFCELCESTNVMSGEGYWDCMDCGLSKNWPVMEENGGCDDIAVVDQDQASEQHFQLRQLHPQVGSEAALEAHIRRSREEEEREQLLYQARFEEENQRHIRRFKEAEEAEQLLHQARFDTENEAHIRRLKGSEVEHEPFEIESAKVWTWDLHAGQMVELANYERLAASHTTTRAAPVMFCANGHPELAGDCYVPVSDLLDGEMEL